MKIAAIIPARMASSRFPGKPLASIGGRPMVEHVYRRALLSTLVDDVYLATCDPEIFDAVESFGGRAIMTSPDHLGCTDRVAEAAQGVDADVIVNVQGDEPLVHPDAIDDLCRAVLVAPDVPCVNLATVITREEDFRNPNQIKVVCDLEGNALFMSRQPIPHTREWGTTRVLRQLGIIAFQRDFLARYAGWEPTPLERAESVDMLRALEHGVTIRMAVTAHESLGVDTPADLAVAESLITSNELTRKIFAAAVTSDAR